MGADRRGGGEDPYLNAVFAAARVKAIQGTDYSATDKLVASPKHFVAYGQPEAGRDYNTTDMSEQRLRNFYLPPFKAAIDAGADTAMCSFNAINGVPGCGNDYTMNEILKGEWNFDGFVESDWTAVAEMRACPPKNPDAGECGHGVAADGPAAAALALNAGVDSEMTSTLIRDFGEQLLAEHRISMGRINDAVRRILRVKFRAGLFEHPYAPYTPAQAEAQMLRPDAVAAARKAAGRSMVLLKNEGVLPLDPAKKTAVIGPLARNEHDMLGPWWGAGRDTDAVTVFDGINAQSPGATYAEGCKLSNAEPPTDDPEGCGSDAGFAEAVAVAQAADQVVLALGETREMSGEAAARSTLDLPGRQEELIRAIKATGKPFAVVLFNGRPLALEDIVGDMPALLEAWFPGVQAGHAVADVVFGKVNPGGKLPVSFPRRLGQVPIYYNHERTGRPCNADSKYNSRHRDIPSCAPLFEFGYGLSYTTFTIIEPAAELVERVAERQRRGHGDVTNTGEPHGRRGRAALHPRPGGEHLAAGPPAARLRARDARARARRRRSRSRSTGATSASTTTAAGSSWSPGQIDVYAGDSSSATLTQVVHRSLAVRSEGPLCAGPPKLFERLRIRRRRRRRSCSEPAVPNRVPPRSPGHGELAHDAVGADGHRHVNGSGRVGRLVVGDVAEREHPDRPAFLEARLPGDQAGRDRAAEDRGAVASRESAGRSGRRDPRRVTPPTSSRTATRYSSRRRAAAGSMLAGLRGDPAAVGGSRP